jgi:hypothetical protein
VANAAKSILFALFGVALFAPAGATPRADAPVRTLRNGVEWSASFVPYGSNAIWNRPMTNQNAPLLLPDSAAIVGQAEANNDGRAVSLIGWGAGWDEGHPVYIASKNDPVVKVQCTQYCDAAYPSQIHIPADARPGDGGDGHITVVQPDGSEFDTWASKQPGSDWRAGDMISSRTAVSCGNFYSGTGFLNRDSAATVGGACLAGGLIRAAELEAGQINHALFTAVDCMTRSYYVYPARQPCDTQCTGRGPHLPNGAHLWLDLNDAQVNALPVTRWEMTILRALHHYGAYVLDSGSGSDRAHGVFSPWFEDDAQFTALGVPNPMVRFAQRAGWNRISIPPHDGRFHSTYRYTFTDSWSPLDGVGGWRAHMRVVDPCYAQGSC